MNKTKMISCERCGSPIASDAFCETCIAYITERASLSLTPQERADEVMMWADLPLRVPFPMIHKRMEELAERPVWTHELARPDLIRDQILGKRDWKGPPESFVEIAPDKDVIVTVLEDA